MATEITMPKLSDTMTEGQLIAWRKGVGDRVERGDIIAEVETDKANMELEAFASGVLLEIRVEPGKMVDVGTVIGIIGAPGESVESPETGKKAEAVPVEAGEEEGEEQETASGEEEREPAPEPAEPEKGPAVPSRKTPQVPTVQAAPVVRRRARELGINLSLVDGSGPGGRILLEDLDRYLESTPEAGQESQQPETTQARPVLGGDISTRPAGGEERPLSRMRAAIARTVSDSWRNAPHFYVTVDVAMDEALEVRRELKERGTAVSVNDLVIKGAALAIAKFPLVNASFAGDRVVLNKEINIGMAVSLPDGLLVPVLNGCDTLLLREIAVQSRELAERARSGKLNQAALTGGTFTVSNLGMYGVSAFAAVILPPQAAILAVGGVQEQVVVRNGQPAVGRVMKLTLSADHRVLDGAYAAQFLRELKQLLEAPVNLLLP